MKRARRSLRNSGSDDLSWKEARSGSGLPWLFSGHWTIGPHVESSSIRGTKWRLYYSGQFVGGEHKTLSDAIRAANQAERSMRDARSQIADKTIPATMVREYARNPISIPVSDPELRDIAAGRPYAIVEHTDAKHRAQPFEAYCGVRGRDEVGWFETSTLADLATAMRVTNHEAAEFLRDPIVRDRLARMVGARRVSYTRSKRHLAYDRVEAVF